MSPKSTLWRPALGLVAILGLPIVLVYAVGERNAANGPDVLARTYADHLAAGRASAASAMVSPVAKAGAGVDAALLSDQVLGAATERIKVVDVHPSSDADETEVGDRASVSVSYRLAGQLNRVELQAERLPNTWGILRNWTLADGLAVPVVIETNIPSIPTGRVGDTSIPVSGPSLNGFPQHPFLLYPGVYRVTGVDSPWVSAAKEVAVDANRARFATSSTVTGQVWYEATPALWDKVRADAAEQAKDCAKAGPAMSLDTCPLEMWLRKDWGTLRVSQVPPIESVGGVQTEYEADGTTLPMTRFSSGPGEFTYSGIPGVRAGDHSFRAAGGIYFSEDGESARVELWSSLSGPGE